MLKHKQAIESAYNDYSDQIYRFIFWQTGDPLLAEDLVSEVFIRAWKHRVMFLDINQRAWLYRVANNLVTDYWRKKKTYQWTNQSK